MAAAAGVWQGMEASCMAISMKSCLKDKDRVYVIAVDQYDTTMRSGVLYHAEEPDGLHFTSYPELIGGLEQQFERLKYPRANMRRRAFGEGVDNCWLSLPTPASAWHAFDEKGKHAGKKCTYHLRVTHREHASWQGNLLCVETGSRFFFSSFQELVFHLDQDLSGRAYAFQADGDREKLQQQFEDCMAIVMECPERLKILPDTLVYRYRKGVHRMTFLIRPIFYEHGTCQGVLYWKERRQECSFRSVLELCGLLSDVLYNDAVWEMDLTEMAK